MRPEILEANGKFKEALAAYKSILMKSKTEI